MARDSFSEIFDEYLWPLTRLPWSIDMAALGERDLPMRRLQEIYRHVDETHLQPRLRRLGRNPSPSLVAQVTRNVIDGSPSDPLYMRHLREPVPRALREEWKSLCEQIRSRAASGRAAENEGR